MAAPLDITAVRALLPGENGGGRGLESVFAGSHSFAELRCECGGVRIGSRFAGGPPGLEELALDPRIVEGLGLTSLFALTAGLQLLRENALLGPDGRLLPALQAGTGVLFASALGEPPLVPVVCGQQQKRPEEPQERLEEPVQRRGRVGPAGLLSANAQLAQVVAARGPNLAVSNTCCSASSAAATAAAFLRDGAADRFLIVAADLALHLPGVAAKFLQLKAANPGASIGDAVCPFGPDRSGLVFGEGASAMLLERADRAALRPLARVERLFLANSAYHGTRLCLEHIAACLQACVAAFLEEAQLSLAEFSRRLVYIANDTFTPSCVAIEVAALERVFGSHLLDVTISSTKACTGHLMGVSVEELVAASAFSVGGLPAVKVLARDPAFAHLRLYEGGGVPRFEYVLRIALGFGSQVGITLLSRPTPRPCRDFEGK